MIGLSEGELLLEIFLSQMMRSHLSSPTPVLSPTVVSSVRRRPDTQTEHRDQSSHWATNIDWANLLSNNHSYHCGTKVERSWILSMGMQAETSKPDMTTNTVSSYLSVSGAARKRNVRLSCR